MIKVYSWNVNGVRAAVKKGMLKWLSQESPDILCLQEIKAQVADLEELILAPFNYQSYWGPADKKGYSGVAIYSKTKPLSVKIGLGIKEFDSEGRSIVADYGAFTLINCYFPNSRRDHSRLDYKLRFCDVILEMSEKLTKQKKGFVLCGDINIAHKDIDLANPKTNRDTAGFLPEERAWLDRYLEKGFIDSFRMFNKEPGQYTWWSQRPGVRQKNIGWRIDSEYVNDVLAPKVKAAAIHAEVMGSDHCPISIDLDVKL
jgi:exodeoxyribonuclease-3